MQLSDIRSQIYLLLRETSSTDSNFTDAQINSFINQSIRLMVPIIEQPRKFSSGTQVVAGTATYTIPTDFVMLKTVYFGDKTITGDDLPLEFKTEQWLRAHFPNWRDTSTGARGRPKYIILLDDDTFLLFPTPDATESATGKLLTYDYLFIPTDLSSDSDTPDLPLPYHDLIKFYACYLCYLNLGKKDEAVLVFKSFTEHHKLIQRASTIESEENLSFQWIGDERDMEGGGVLY